MPRNIAALVFSEEQQRQLRQWVVALGTPQQVALRRRIVLGLASGRSEVAVAAENKVNRKTVRLWRERFIAQGIEGLWGDRTRPRPQGHLWSRADQEHDRRYAPV